MDRAERQKLIESAQQSMIAGMHALALDSVRSLSLDFEADPDTSRQVLQIRLNCLNGLSRWGELIKTGEEWISTLQRAGVHDVLCRVHEHVGHAYTRTGSPQLAERHIRAAIHIATWQLLDRKLAIINHRLLALMFKGLGLWKQARHEIETALSLAEEINAVDELGSLHNNLAIIVLKSGNVLEAEAFIEKAEDAFMTTGRQAWALKARLSAAKLLRMRGQYSKAIELLMPTLEQLRSLKHVREATICLEYIGDCYLGQRNYKSALAYYENGMKDAEESAPGGDLIPELCHRMAEALVNLGEANQAILLCERGLRVARDTGDRYEECATHRVLAMAHRAAGNPTKAHRIAMEGIELGRSYEIPYELARTLAWSGETRLQSRGRDDQMLGRMLLWEARAIFERIALPNEVHRLDRILGFDEEDAEGGYERGIEALAEIATLDRGALRFGIVTCSPDVSEAVATIQSVAPSRIPVLITGPSGVGKELLAQALHRMSDRRKMPFVAVNCGAISATLIESELFGHERGAFTGAIAPREGLFASADKGTIFLDEVGELPQSTQATLLRILETGELRKVGSDDVRSIDVRVVAATNADLEELVERGRFRRDLFFRLEGVMVRVPPLREREDDIRALFRFFFAEATAAARKKLTVTADVEPLLCAYSWPGNVRELRNEVVRAVTMAPDGAVLGREAFLPKLRRKTPAALRHAREQEDVTAEERQRIIEALRAHSGNKADAARSLGGMKRTTLLYKIDRLKIRPEEYQVNES